MYVFLLSAFNKTVAITPYLKTIILDHIEEHKTYQISIQMASRTLNYGPPSTFNVSTHRPNRGKGETTNGIVIQCSYNYNIYCFFPTKMQFYYILI